MFSNQELADKFITSLGLKNVRPDNSTKLFAISFIGTTGVGKTTVSQKLAEKLGFYVANSDEIRRFLNREGFPGKFPDQDLVNFMGKKVSEFLYQTKTSHIIDADMIRFYDKALANATSNGAKLLIIRLVCPEEIILKRLEERQSKINEDRSQNYSEVGFSLSVMEEYL
ncbi:MAG: AAA family ATPase, partial [Candidatus Moranbacteria bacterium]|nr:AAA family ATPase [Candidatus Moranbacteria bacterium]